jgi:hypothetical protein
MHGDGDDDGAPYTDMMLAGTGGVYKNQLKYYFFFCPSPPLFFFLFPFSRPLSSELHAAFGLTFKS